MSGTAIHEPRSYQLEMLRESLKKNVIVTMDTGSGKTTVAVLRIAHELRKSPEDKLIWFLCPSVELAEQQHRFLSSQLPAVRTRLLLGRDGVEHWSTKSIWDDVLRDIQVTVSTYQVLLDALIHDFVAMSRLSLLVIDEAHHCSKNAPVSRIMKDFYHKSNNAGQPVPAILGLTATPVLKSNVKDLSLIESALDAISCSPNASLEDLQEHVHHPLMQALMYDPAMIMDRGQYWRFIEVQSAINIEEDPWVKHLKQENKSASRSYSDAILRRKTWCQGQVRKIESNATTLHTELGPWASEQYLERCCSKVKVELERHLLDFAAGKLHRHELQWLHALFEKAGFSGNVDDNSSGEKIVSEKFLRLVDFLKEGMTTTSAAIVFVKTKATVYFLRRLLESTEATKDILRCGSLVGQSNVLGKATEISDILDRNQQKEASIEDLRRRAKNIIICTSVAEEGLDISACNLVICFDKPLNLKSFVQRRGRARAKQSRFITLFATTENLAIKGFMDAEAEMKALYMDQMRELEDRQIEEMQQNILVNPKVLRAATTNATITWDEAVAHLHHFCDKLPRTKFGDAQPLYTFQGRGPFTCTITLPSTLDVSIRTFESSQPWPTERLAKKDAAFIAYSELYARDLINEHLLPQPVLDAEIAAATADMAVRKGSVDVETQHDPMAILAATWSGVQQCYRFVLEIPERKLKFYMYLPVTFDSLPPLQLSIDREETVHVQFKFDGCCHVADTVHWASRTTKALLWSMFQSRMDEFASKFPILFTPFCDAAEAEYWLSEHTGLDESRDIGDSDLVTKLAGRTFIRQRKTNGRPLILLGLDQHLAKVGEKRDREEVVLCAVCRKIPARTDFLHRPSADKVSKEESLSYIPVAAAVIDNMQPDAVFFASLIPSIMHHTGRRIMAEELNRELSVQGQVFDSALILESITASAAEEVVNYQRLEFLGDSVLGFCSSILLLAQYPLWHEGYLTQGKERIISNSVLAKITQDTGLARYLLATKFTGAKWKPPHNASLPAGSAKQRSVSTKTLADLVEALIAVGYLSGGLQGASSMIMTLYKPLEVIVSWKPIDIYVRELRNTVQDLPLSLHMQPLEALVGHHFEKPALLIEAMTHASYSSESSVRSYERLEFAGDSILSILVTNVVFHHKPALPVSQMHLLRTAAVNAHFLAFMMMRMTTPVVRKEIVKPVNLDKTAASGCVTEEVEQYLAIHDFIQHHPSEGFTQAKTESLRWFHKLHDKIEAALNAGKRYPWTLFETFAPEKFFSDVIESILCAIYIDSNGSLEACEAFLEKLGIMDFLTHAIANAMHLWQPKEELGQAALQEKVDYRLVDDVARDDVRAELGEEDWDDEAVKVACRVFVGERWICTALGRGRFGAETRAAEKALTILAASRQNAS